MRPNILYLNTHDAGRYIEPYGHAVPTPNLQRFAREAAVFRHAHAAAPTCTPSRVGLLTGAAPHSLGCLGLGHRGWGLGRPECHLAHLLTAAGYLTALAGTQHEHPDPAAIGYQRILQDEGPGVTEDRAADFLAAQGAGDRSKPFFLAVGWNDTHRSFPAPVPADDADYCRPPDPLPDCAAIRRDMAAYRRAAAEVDARFGRVLQALEDAGLKEDTLVLCTTDHGIPFPMMKCTCTDHGTGVFFMLRWPGRIRPAVHDALVSQIDWLPTLCDELAIAPPAWLQGRSLWPALDGKADDWPDNTPLTTNPTQPSGTLGIEAVSAFRNDQFVYLRVDATQMLPMGAQVRISALDSNGEAQVIVASSRSVFSRDALVTDAAAVFGEVAELRLPRRLFNVNQPQLTQICVQPTPLTLPSCFDAPVTPQLRSERDPSPLRGPDGPQAFVTNGANLRVAPDTEADLIANLPSRELLEIVGRDTSGEWLFVRNGRYEGWMAAFLLVINADIDTLNIIG